MWSLIPSYFCLFVFVDTHVPQSIHGSQKVSFGSWPSPSTLCRLWELNSGSQAAHTFIHWATLLAPFLFFVKQRSMAILTSQLCFLKVKVNVAMTYSQLRSEKVVKGVLRVETRLGRRGIIKPVLDCKLDVIKQSMVFKVSIYYCCKNGFCLVETHYFKLNTTH